MLDPKVEAERKKAEELQKEKEAVIKEYEERMKKKQGWWKGLVGGATSSTDKKKDEKKDGDGKDDNAEEREKDAKVSLNHLRRCRIVLVDPPCIVRLASSNLKPKITSMQFPKLTTS